VNGRRPDDQDILDCLALGARSSARDVRDRLRPRFPSIDTVTVRRRLRALAKAGRCLSTEACGAVAAQWWLESRWTRR